nr:hypothetical protein [Mesorhizobium sp.]
MVESESLLNDGAAAVGFGFLVSIAAGAGATPLAIAWSFVWTVAGGIAVGAAVAAALLLTSRLLPVLFRTSCAARSSSSSFRRCSAGREPIIDARRRDWWSRGRQQKLAPKTRLRFSETGGM